MRPEDYNSLPKEKFVLVNEDKKLHDKELVTKPVGFFMDAMHRFARNKGSIVGAIVIGILVLYALIAPIFSPYKVSYNDAYYVRTLPKLFTSEKIDILDGATNKTGNVATFINYYSMGLETGHNAVKRQEYKYNPETQMYSYRLDSYESVGTVFMSSVAKKDYQAIQDYQDKTGIQVIYPITDVSKRPQSKQNSTNANYWYETKIVDGNDVPVNYTFNDDGSVTLSNIYKAYSQPLLSSSSKVTAFANLETKDGGYAVKITDANENVVGYIAASVFEDENSCAFTSDIKDATVFEYNPTYKTLVFTLGDHENSSLDGKYFFGLNAVTDSLVNIVPISKLGGDEYIPFSLYEEGKIASEISTEKTYSFIANRPTYETKKYYVGNMSLSDSSFNIAESLSASNAFKFTSSGTGYILSFKQGKASYYLVAKITDGTPKFDKTTNAAEATLWGYDVVNNAVFVDISGTNYYLGIHTDGAYVGTISLISAANITAEGNSVLYLVDNSGTPIASVAENTNYYFMNTRVSVTNNFYCVDGGFNGDNYHSRMRIEGEDKFLYSYAIPKDGNRFEIRVNYHEYYKYYHKEILKDRIRDPYFLFGTTATGQDIFTCLASGARFSFIFAISVALVNFIIGTIYGAMEGYYGGKTDMIMERIVEILSAVPFMIVITLLKYHMRGSSQALILFISFFLTGWIGMSGTVRMQFYRFKNQEYVLAARTLGAKDPRIMFKHIFPNSLGTIVTSSVLVIPGMIFSETTLSYLGIINLNDGNMTSVGTLLAAGQPYLVNYPHIIFFPAIFISLLMLCFNLFGNGLRDAFNPSLRGTEE